MITLCVLRTKTFTCKSEQRGYVAPLLARSRYVPGSSEIVKCPEASVATLLFGLPVKLLNIRNRELEIMSVRSFPSFHKYF